MRSREYEEILASLQEVVRRAYALGRSEALKQVVQVMQTDESSWKPLAIAGPTEQVAAPAPRAEEVPWWARPPRAA